MPKNELPKNDQSSKASPPIPEINLDPLVALARKAQSNPIIMKALQAAAKKIAD